MTVLDLFEARASANPNAVAVQFEDQELTYIELNVRADQLASRLGSLGVGPGVFVGLCVERSLEMVVGVLGILKAGGAYLPLDPAYPTQRLSFMLSDAGAKVLLTQRSLGNCVPEFGGSRILLDEPHSLSGAESDRPRLQRPVADDPIYVIYTSGSTGTPKGVVVSHANVVRLFTSTEQWFAFGPNDVWTLFHSIAFDFSVWELWGALLYGGRLVVVPFAVSRSPQDFYRLLRDQRVTVLNQTPSAFRQLIRAEDSLGVAPDLALRFVIFGGEALEVQSLRPWFDRHGDRLPQLVNMYGITETTVHVTYRPIVTPDLSLPMKGSPIGRPIPDLQVHVLDENLQPIATGEVGELYVGGAGVACGYLNRKELTDQRFIRDPHVDDPGARLYKSGDLARILPDGQLEFHGRADGQVKIRGFRMEVGEIEAALSRQPEVAEAVVVAREDVHGDRRLVAYVTFRNGKNVEPSMLKASLKEKLPDYMVPAAIVVLDSLPLTTNGKIDRAALPAPEQRSSSNAAPTTDMERRIMDIWTQCLHCPVGLDDNFFDLGGTSMHVAEVHTELQKAREDVPITLLFEHPTIRSLARQLSGVTNNDALTNAAVDRARQQRAAMARRRPVS